MPARYECVVQWYRVHTLPVDIMKLPSTPLLVTCKMLQVFGISKYDQDTDGFERVLVAAIDFEEWDEGSH